MSALPNWGELAKSVDDPETIEEAIVRLIAEHAADPTAHLGSGESLEAHKTEGMIDHPAGSVAVDKLPQKRVIISAYESLDGWLDFATGSGGKSHDLGTVQVTTGATINSTSVVWTVPSFRSALLMNKNFSWKSTVKFSHNTSQLSYFGIGYIADGADFNGFGFKVSGGQLYAWMGDFTNFTEFEITGVTLTTPHAYEIRYQADPQVVRFYIDGTLVKEWSSGNFPEDDDGLAGFWIKNTAAALRVLYTADLVYEQDN